MASSWKSILEDLNAKWRSIITSGDWNLAKETSRVKVWQKASTDWNGTIYKTEGIIDADPSTVFKFVEPFPDGERTNWDPTVKERILVEEVDKDTVVLRSVTHSAAMGLISSRDFVDIVVKGTEDGGYFTRGVGVTHPKCPVTAATVRGYNYPCGIICQPVQGEPNKTKLTTIIQSNLNGLLPKSVVEAALPGSQIDFFTMLAKMIKND